MKVKKLFADSNLSNNMVVQLPDSSFARFLITPFRRLSENDLIKVPYYRAAGKNGEEAEKYMYKLYGLEK